jgi:prolyl-tRNA synthetase
MMGGKVSHEFMLLTDIGEDSIVTCPECGFRANMEACDAITENEADETLVPLTEVFTGEAATIAEVGELLHMPDEKTCKAVVYQRNADDSYVLIFVRGDKEVNETKLTNFLKSEIHPAVDIENANLAAGNIGPVNLETNATVLFDRSLVGATNLVCGANKPEYHYTGFTPARDLPEDTQYFDLSKAVEGGICPNCKKHSLKVSRGIEVGNIFQLGKRYTEAMGMTYDAENGERKNPIMGCYGIGVGRLIASVCEAHHDDYGPIWPITIAPWQVEICALRIDDENVRNAAEKLYKELEDAGVEVLFDDRPVSAGVMFSDADLFGAPVRVVISPKTLSRNAFELAARDKSFRLDIAIEGAAETVQAKVRELIAAVNAKVPERM